MNHDVTAVFITHREGWVAYPSLKSMTIAKQHAEKNGISVEVIVILDKTDTITETFILANSPTDTRFEYIDEGDASASRNHAISIANGEFVSFLDGDDLWCANWLTEAFCIGSISKQQEVYHPQINVLFDQEDLLLFRRDCEDPDRHPEHRAHPQGPPGQRGPRDT